jgi:hypothetical protein
MAGAGNVGNTEVATYKRTPRFGGQFFEGAGRRAEPAGEIAAEALCPVTPMRQFVQFRFHIISLLLFKGYHTNLFARSR